MTARQLRKWNKHKDTKEPTQILLMMLMDLPLLPFLMNFKRMLPIRA